MKIYKYMTAILVFVFLLASCSNANTNDTTASESSDFEITTAESTEDQTDPSETTELAFETTSQAEASPSPLETMVLKYFKDTTSSEIDIQRLTFESSFPIYDSTIEVYTLEYLYPEMNAPITDQYAFFITDAAGEISELKDVTSLNDRTLAQRAEEVFWRVGDLEYSLSRQGYPGYYGLGSPGLGLAASDFADPAEEIFTDWDPIYSEGSYYGQVTYDDLNYTYYYNSDLAKMDPDSAKLIIALSTTRTDMITFRGGYVGMTRQELLKRYPDLKKEPIWSFEGDYLWLGNEMGIGYLLFFYFEDDVVTRIELINMFD